MQTGCVFQRFSGTPAIIIPLLFMLVFFCFPWPPAHAEEAAPLQTGGYTFEEGETVENPWIFISLEPESDRIRFESGAEIDTEVAFEPEAWAIDFEQWKMWHRETGADPARIGDYDLEPLGAFTMGRTYDRIDLEEGARIINRAEVGEGMKTLGSVDLVLEKDAVIHGDWTALSLGNFESTAAEDFFTVNITNRGTIGTYTEDFGFEPFEKSSQHGIVFFEVVDGSVVNEAGGVIRSDHTGIYTNYKEQDEAVFVDFDPEADLDEALAYAPGRSFSLDNYGEIKGDFFGLYEGGGVEDVRVVNHASGYMEGNSAGIYLIRGGQIENRGTIKGDTTGIFVRTGTPEIIHSGTIVATDEEFGDAIRLGEDTVGGTITLHAAVDGNILHIGDSEEALLFLKEPLEDQTNTAPLSVGNIGFGEGAVIQQGGIWSYEDLAARRIVVEGGEMRLRQEVAAGEDVAIESDAILTMTGGTLLTENLINQGRLNFYDGEITIDGGVFNHADSAGAPRSLTIQGDDNDHNPRLRMAEGAGTAGIDNFNIGGDHAATLFLEHGSTVSVQNRLALKDKGLLKGSGTVSGDILAESGGVIRPGHSEDSTGSLAIDGDLLIQEGGVLDIGVAQEDGNNSKIAVSGEAVIDGSTLKVTDYSNFQLRDGSVHPFLTASNVIGRFDRIESFAPMVYTFDPDYEEEEVSFTVIRHADYSDYTLTQNHETHMATLESAWEAEQLDDLRFRMDWLLNNVLEGRTPPARLVETIGQIGPEPYQASYRMAADNANQMNRRLLQGARTSRLQIGRPGQEQGAQNARQGGAQAMANMLGTALALAADDPGALARANDVSFISVAANAQGSNNAGGRAQIMTDELGESIRDTGLRVFYGGYRRIGDVDDGPTRMGHDYKVRGGYLGFERARNGAIAGIGLSYANSEVEFDNDSGDLNAHNFRLGPHVTIDRGALEVDVALNAGWHANRQKRNMPNIDRQSVVRYNIWDGSLYTGARYNLTFRDKWRLVPSAGMQYTHQYREGFTERRAGDARLKMASDSNDVLRGLLGLRFSRELRGSRFVLVPELYAGWEYDLLDPDMALDASFAEAQDSRFSVDANAAGRDALSYGGGLTMLFGDYNVAFAKYELEEQKDGNSYTFSAGVKWNF